MRRNRVLRSSVSTNRSKFQLPTNSIAAGQTSQGLFSSLNKLYIRNFHEYHSRSRSSDPKTAKQQYEEHRHQDERLRQRVAFEPNPSNNSIQVEPKDTTLHHNYVLKNADSAKTISATVAASALMRQNRYSTKAFFSKSVLNQTKLKKSKDKRKELHTNRMVAAYKLEAIQDNLERLQDHFEVLTHKNRIVNRECTLLGRDLEKMKSDYMRVYENVIRKDLFLKEEGKIRVFEMIPKYEFARTDSSQSDVKSLSNRSNDIHNNCISNGLAETDVDDDKKHEGSEKHKPSELNLIENGCDSIANENSNQKQSAIELLRNCLTENGNRYLTNKVQQLLEDNERLQKYKKGLETRLIESKLKQVQLKVKPNKSINGGSCVNETSDNFNQSSQINGRITATESKGTTNGLKNPIVIAPKVRENGLIRSNRHTINLPNKRFVGKSMQRRKEAPDFYEIFEKKTNSIENLNKLRNEIQLDEQELKSQHLKQTIKLLQDESNSIKSALKDRQLQEQELRIDIENVKCKLNDKLKRLHELNRANESLRKRMQQLENDPIRIE